MVSWYGNSDEFHSHRSSATRSVDCKGPKGLQRTRSISRELNTSLLVDRRRFKDGILPSKADIFGAIAEAELRW